MYTLFFWNSAGEREQHGTHPTQAAAEAEQAQMQEEWGDDESRFEILVNFG